MCWQNSWWKNLYFNTATVFEIFHCIFNAAVAQIYNFHISTHTHKHVGITVSYDSCFFTLFPPFHVALSFLPSPCALVGGKQSAGLLCDPRFDQTSASALGQGSGGRWPLARPPAGAARRSQWPRDSLCRHSEARLRNLSGKIFTNFTFESFLTICN